MSTNLDGAKLLQLVKDQGLLIIGSPKVSNKVLILKLHLIESLEHGFFSGEEHLEDVHGRCRVIILSLNAIEVQQLLSKTLSSIGDKSSGIVDLTLNLTDSFVNLHLILGHIESVT